jgi:hypothetical protein
MLGVHYALERNGGIRDLYAYNASPSADAEAVSTTIFGQQITRYLG